MTSLGKDVSDILNKYPQRINRALFFGEKRFNRSPLTLSFEKVEIEADFIKYFYSSYSPSRFLFSFGLSILCFWVFAVVSDDFPNSLSSNPDKHFPFTMMNLISGALALFLTVITLMGFHEGQEFMMEYVAAFYVCYNLLSVGMRDAFYSSVSGSFLICFGLCIMFRLRFCITLKIFVAWGIIQILFLIFGVILYKTPKYGALEDRHVFVLCAMNSIILLFTAVVLYSTEQKVREWFNVSQNLRDYREAISGLNAYYDNFVKNIVPKEYKRYIGRARDTCIRASELKYMAIVVDTELMNGPAYLEDCGGGNDNIKKKQFLSMLKMWFAAVENLCSHFRLKKVCTEQYRFYCFKEYITSERSDRPHSEVKNKNFYNISEVEGVMAFAICVYLATSYLSVNKLGFPMGTRTRICVDWGCEAFTKSFRHTQYGLYGNCMFRLKSLEKHQESSTRRATDHFVDVCSRYHSMIQHLTEMREIPADRNMGWLRDVYTTTLIPGIVFSCESRSERWRLVLRKACVGALKSWGESPSPLGELEEREKRISTFDSLFEISADNSKKRFTREDEMDRRRSHTYEKIRVKLVSLCGKERSGTCWFVLLFWFAKRLDNNLRFYKRVSDWCIELKELYIFIRNFLCRPKEEESQLSSSSSSRASSARSKLKKWLEIYPEELSRNECGLLEINTPDTMQFRAQVLFTGFQVVRIFLTIIFILVNEHDRGGHSYSRIVHQITIWVFCFVFCAQMFLLLFDIFIASVFYSGLSVDNNVLLRKLKELISTTFTKIYHYYRIYCYNRIQTTLGEFHNRIKAFFGTPRDGSRRILATISGISFFFSCIAGMTYNVRMGDEFTTRLSGERYVSRIFTDRITWMDVYVLGLLYELFYFSPLKIKQTVVIGLIYVVFELVLMHYFYSDIFAKKFAVFENVITDIGVSFLTGLFVMYTRSFAERHWVLKQRRILKAKREAIMKREKCENLLYSFLPSKLIVEEFPKKVMKKEKLKKVDSGENTNEEDHIMEEDEDGIYQDLTKREIKGIIKERNSIPGTSKQRRILLSSRTAEEESIPSIHKLNRDMRKKEYQSSLEALRKSYLSNSPSQLFTSRVPRHKFVFRTNAIFVCLMITRRLPDDMSRRRFGCNEARVLLMKFRRIDRIISENHCCKVSITWRRFLFFGVSLGDVLNGIKEIVTEFKYSKLSNEYIKIGLFQGEYYNTLIGNQLVKFDVYGTGIDMAKFLCDESAFPNLVHICYWNLKKNFQRKKNDPALSRIIDDSERTRIVSRHDMYVDPKEMPIFTSKILKEQSENDHTLKPGELQEKDGRVLIRTVYLTLCGSKYLYEFLGEKKKKKKSKKSH